MLSSSSRTGGIVNTLCEHIHAFVKNVAHPETTELYMFPNRRKRLTNVLCGAALGGPRTIEA